MCLYMTNPRDCTAFFITVNQLLNMVVLKRHLDQIYSHPSYLNIRKLQNCTERQYLVFH